jgi:hypothetical protein
VVKNVFVVAVADDSTRQRQRKDEVVGSAIGKEALLDLCVTGVPIVVLILVLGSLGSSLLFAFCALCSCDAGNNVSGTSPTVLLKCVMTMIKRLSISLASWEQLQADAKLDW